LTKGYEEKLGGEFELEKEREVRFSPRGREGGWESGRGGDGLLESEV